METWVFQRTHGRDVRFVEDVVQVDVRKKAPFFVRGEWLPYTKGKVERGPAGIRYDFQGGFANLVFFAPCGEAAIGICMETEA